MRERNIAVADEMIEAGVAEFSASTHGKVIVTNDTVARMYRAMENALYDQNDHICDQMECSGAGRVEQRILAAAQNWGLARVFGPSTTGGKSVEVCAKELLAALEGRGISSGMRTDDCGQKFSGHTSSCAVNNGPALLTGICDCGLLTRPIEPGWYWGFIFRMDKTPELGWLPLHISPLGTMHAALVGDHPAGTWEGEWHIGPRIMPPSGQE